MIWGGVLQRHPKLRVVFTEFGSSWVAGALVNMDYTYEGSYLRRDVHSVLPHKPSEYFARQCFLGSSIFSRAEVGARHEIGIDKMMLGMDYPHHEGTWAAGPGTLAYIQATIGACAVPADEALPARRCKQADHQFVRRRRQLSLLEPSRPTPVGGPAQ